MKATMLTIVGVCIGMTISSGLLALAEAMPLHRQTVQADAFVSAMLDQHHRGLSEQR